MVIGPNTVAAREVSYNSASDQSSSVQSRKNAAAYGWVERQYVCQYAVDLLDAWLVAAIVVELDGQLQWFQPTYQRMRMVVEGVS
jgi:hypothetical protein